MGHQQTSGGRGELGHPGQAMDIGGPKEAAAAPAATAAARGPSQMSAGVATVSGTVMATKSVQLQRQVTQLSEDLGEARREIAGLVSRCQDLEKKLLQANSKRRKQQKEATEQNDKLEQALRHAQSERGFLSARAKDSQAALEAVQAQRDEAYEAMRMQVFRMQDDLRVKTEECRRHAGLQQKLDDQALLVDALQQEVGLTKEALQTLSRAEREHRRQARACQRKIEVVLTSGDSLLQRIEEQNALIKELKMARDTLDDAAREATSSASLVEGKLAKAKAELCVAEDGLRKAAQREKGLQDGLGQVKAEMIDTQTRLGAERLLQQQASAKAQTLQDELSSARGWLVECAAILIGNDTSRMNDSTTLTLKDLAENVLGELRAATEGGLQCHRNRNSSRADDCPPCAPVKSPPTCHRRQLRNLPRQQQIVPLKRPQPGGDPPPHQGCKQAATRLRAAVMSDALHQQAAMPSRNHPEKPPALGKLEPHDTECHGSTANPNGETQLLTSALKGRAEFEAAECADTVAELEVDNSPSGKVSAPLGPTVAVQSLQSGKISHREQPNQLGEPASKPAQRVQSGLLQAENELEVEKEGRKVMANAEGGSATREPGGTGLTTSWASGASGVNIATRKERSEGRPAVSTTVAPRVISPQQHKRSCSEAEDDSASRDKVEEMGHEPEGPGGEGQEGAGRLPPRSSSRDALGDIFDSFHSLSQ